jgi:predicted ATP-dependent endonuclease of OLD family
MRGQRDPIPLGSMGDGMRRILTLAMCAVNVENGFLLIDEIDTGLYYEVQADMWRLILETAQRLDVQVFATTHSWDCVSAFQEA